MPAVFDGAFSTSCSVESGYPLRSRGLSLFYGLLRFVSAGSLVHGKRTLCTTAMTANSRIERSRYSYAFLTIAEPLGLNTMSRIFTKVEFIDVFRKRGMC